MAKTEDGTASEFLDNYVKRYVEAEKLKSAASVRSRIRALKDHLGARPVRDLEPIDVLEDFKAAYGSDRAIATVNRTLGILRYAINWGMGRTPPVFQHSPFFRFGLKIKTKGECRRDRRLLAGEEQALLDAANSMNSAEYGFVGASMHDRIVAALETGCRRGEMLRIRNRHIAWETHQILIPAENAKDAEARRIPFQPGGRLAQVLEARRFLGPDAFVFGSASGAFQSEFRTAWETLRLLANGKKPKQSSAHARVQRDELEAIDLRWHDLRHEAACRWLGKGLDIRAIQLLLGHADLKTTQRYLNVTDAELMKLMNEKLWKENEPAGSQDCQQIVSRSA